MGLPQAPSWPHELKVYCQGNWDDDVPSFQTQSSNPCTYSILGVIVSGEGCADTSHFGFDLCSQLSS